MTPEEALKLENAALYKIVERFARLRADEAHPGLAEAVDRAREELAVLKRQKKMPRELDAVEKATQHIMCSLQRTPIENPVLVLARFSLNDWQAAIEDYEEEMGTGEGTTPSKAVQDLYIRVKNYQMTRHPQTPESFRKKT